MTNTEIKQIIKLADECISAQLENIRDQIWGELNDIPVDELMDSIDTLQLFCEVEVDVLAGSNRKRAERMAHIMENHYEAQLPVTNDPYYGSYGISGTSPVDITNLNPTNIHSNTVHSGGCIIQKEPLINPATVSSEVTNKSMREDYIRNLNAPSGKSVKKDRLY